MDGRQRCFQLTLLGANGGQQRPAPIIAIESRSGTEMITTHTSRLIIRVANPEDALCIAVLGMQVFLDTYATEGIRDSIAREVLTAFSPQAVMKALEQPCTSMMVAEVEGHLVGFAQVAMETAHELIATPGAAELQRLYIQEKFAGKGIGNQLLQHAEQQARLRGAPLLWATVWIRNARALAFYPRQGYECMGCPRYVLQHETHENRLFAKRL